MTARGSRTDNASRVWTAMHDFVVGQDRIGAMRAALDLGPGRVGLLIRLTEGPMTLREIARALEIDPAAATLSADKLEARGLVQRTAHPDDNRRKLVHLTEAGREAAERGRRILTEPPAELANLSAEDLARLEAILGRLELPGR